MTTPNQFKIYEFIKAFIKKHGYSPSLVEIAQGIGVRSKGLISRYVHALADDDLIDLVPNEQRNIRLKPVVERQIPLLGNIAAGVPIEAIANEDALDVVDMLTDTHRFNPFALSVKGDSMIDEGIYDGDIILCEQRKDAHNGEIVVALIDEQFATLKRFHKHPNGTITLTPANIALKPQVYEAQRIQVQGIFRGLIRLSK